MVWVLDRTRTWEVVPGKRVLRSDEFLALRSAAEIIRDAETIASNVIGNAKKEAANLEAEAAARAKKLTDSTQAAFDAKRQEGYEVGLAEGKQEMAEQMMEMCARNVQNFSAYADVVLNMVMRALRRIIGEFSDTELVHRIVANSLQVIRNQRQAVLKVCPDQAPAARASIAELSKGGGHLQTMVEVVADGRLEKNTCLIETEVGIVDASLDVQLEAIRKVLERTLAAS